MKSKFLPLPHYRIATQGLLLGSWFCSLLLLTANLHAGSYQVGVAPSAVKVMIQGAAQGWPFEGAIANHYDLYLARGEHEAMQVVVIAANALTNAHVAVSAPQEIHGAGPLNGEAKAWLVGHVDVTDSPNPAEVDSSYLPNYYGWFPDPLLTFTNTCNINAGDRVAFWIDVATLREATAGDYMANDHRHRRQQPEHQHPTQHPCVGFRVAVEGVPAHGVFVQRVHHRRWWGQLYIRHGLRHPGDRAASRGSVVGSPNGHDASVWRSRGILRLH